jgi:hypothetical protein
MPTTERRHFLDELAALGGDIFNRQVRPKLRPEDDGKFVAIDVETSDYEINQDDYAAVMALRARKPEADIWLMRAGYPATCRIRSGSMIQGVVNARVGVLFVGRYVKTNVFADP